MRAETAASFRIMLLYLPVTNSLFFSLDIEHFDVLLQLVGSLFADRNMASG